LIFSNKVDLSQVRSVVILKKKTTLKFFNFEKIPFFMNQKQLEQQKKYTITLIQQQLEQEQQQLLQQ